jgi:UDP-2,3-diacylglucosamine hydrolase
MSLFVISDLHIGDSDDPLYHSLLALIRTRATSGDTLVLAGDIFDLFIGNKKYFVEKYSELFKEIRAAAARGVEIHYIEGNHDFLLKGVIQGLPGVHHHGEKVAIEIEKKKFFVAHGDLANSKDYGYRFLRAFLRSFILKLAVFIAPGRFVHLVGRHGSKYSRELAPRLPTDLPIERREKLRMIYRSFAAEKLAHGYDFVVMGHCHDLDEKFFKIGSRTGQYVNVGYPRAHGSFLSWQAGDERICREKLPG